MGCKFQSYLVSAFRVIEVDIKNSKTIDLYSAYVGKFLQTLDNYVSSAMRYKVGTCVILSIMNWGIHSFWPKYTKQGCSCLETDTFCRNIIKRT